MAKDYKRTKQAVKKAKVAKKRSVNFLALKWISFGAILGISLIVLLPHLPFGNLANQLKQLSFASVIQQKKKDNSAVARDLTRQAESKKHQPSFDFYTLLPEMKVEIPPKEETKTKAVVTPTPAPTQTISPVVPITTPTITAKVNALAPTKQPAAARYNMSKRGSGYTVQIASFKNFSDADATKTQLLVSGFPVRLQTSTSSTGELLHLLKMGPYKNKDFAQRDRQRLVAMNYKQAVITEE